MLRPLIARDVASSQSPPPTHSVRHSQIALSRLVPRLSRCGIAIRIDLAGETRATLAPYQAPLPLRGHSTGFDDNAAPRRPQTRNVLVDSISSRLEGETPALALRRLAFGRLAQTRTLVPRPDLEHLARRPPVPPALGISSRGLSHLGDVVYALLSCAGGSQRCSRSPQPYPSTLLPRPRRSPDLVPSGIPSRHLSDVLRTLALYPGDFDESPHRDVRLQRHQPAPPLRPLARSGLYDGLREAVALRGVFDAYPGMSNACSIAGSRRRVRLWVIRRATSGFEDIAGFGSDRRPPSRQYGDPG